MSNSPILLGQCVGSWGLQGYIKIISWTSPRENIFNYHPWYLSNQSMAMVTMQDLSAYTLAKTKILRSGASLAVKFKGITSIDEVLALQGKFIYILEKQLPIDEDEYYWHELIGMSVVNQDKLCLGEVSELLVTGAHDVLKVTYIEDNGEQNHCLIPFVRPHYVISVDRATKTIVVNWERNWI